MKPFDNDILNDFFNDINKDNLDSYKLAQFLIPFNEINNEFKISVISSKNIEELLVDYIDIQIMNFRSIQDLIKDYFFNHFYMEFPPSSTSSFEDLFIFKNYDFKFEVHCNPHMNSSHISEFVNNTIERFVFIYYHNDKFFNAPFKFSFSNSVLVLEFHPNIEEFYLK